MIQNLIDKLKELIDKNGLDYLYDNPYPTYLELLSADPAEAKTAGAVLLALVRNIKKADVRNMGDGNDLSKLIQRECGLNKRLADKAAIIFLTLYSRDNEKEWRARDREGWRKFTDTELHVDWNGNAVWETSNGYVACHYKAGMELQPLKGIKPDKELEMKLGKNPYMKLADIQKIYQKSLTNYLDVEFEDYCTCDDYYQPVVEDFEIEYYLKDWADKHGFELIDYEGDGYDDGYEPSFRHW